MTASNNSVLSIVSWSIFSSTPFALHEYIRQAKQRGKRKKWKEKEKKNTHNNSFNIQQKPNHITCSSTTNNWPWHYVCAFVYKFALVEKRPNDTFLMGSNISVGCPNIFLCSTCLCLCRCVAVIVFSRMETHMCMAQHRGSHVSNSVGVRLPCIKVFSHWQIGSSVWVSVSKQLNKNQNWLWFKLRNSRKSEFSHLA